MLPHDIDEGRLPLPPGDRRSVVVISGGSLRDVGFG